MKFKTSISVVMPYFNCEQFITSAVESILQQSFSNFEFIIINDGSSDCSASKILKFKDKRIRHIQLTKNKGNYIARNIGMSCANGKYICVMDADDIAIKERLQIQFEFLESHSAIGLIGSQGVCIDTFGKQTGIKIEKPICSTARIKTLLLLDNFTLHPSLMFRTSLLHKYNLFYNEQYKIASDYDFVMQWAAHVPIRNIKEVLIKYRKHDCQISSKNRQSQSFYADEIRIKQLQNLIPIPSTGTKNLYLKLVKRIKLDKLELKKAVSILNVLLDKNSQTKLHNQRYLYDLFYYLLSDAAT